MVESEGEGEGEGREKGEDDEARRESAWGRLQGET